ncbi:unnamed protein product [Mytilus coruscus]|uniref:Ig-like domain-containing protein n=1 Tax=Mytilus coruscus TaxID=42192 RepID=A0A6J8BS06_MYTCO|nr:unnamed protein product [Mytilus coruscus]
MRTVALILFAELLANGDNFDRAVIHVSIGETITLKCPLLSHLPSDVQWNHIDSQTVISDGFNINPKISNKTEYTKFKIVGNTGIGEYNLKISNIEIDDKGIYRCDSEINGKPESSFFNLIVHNYQTDIGIISNENTTTTYNHKIQVVIVGIFKTIRSYLNESDNNMNTERATEFLYETINDTAITNPLAASSARSNVSILQLHTAGRERFPVHSSATNTQDICNALQSPLKTQDAFCGNNTLHNKNDTDSNTDISSTHSLGTSLGFVYEMPYENHYHPLGRTCERVSHLYDEC